ncbi:multiple organellar RNA editing factor 3, mitochondrial-like isoform X1 [Dendrobium catenatum]|uniref:multiple organellar RNA editing factor 3, mitochondrial-like isoform X1 n=1 Tax=Dendrobium catenatum TaxID=906689 RepID=UPI0009F3FF7A|nr:multiple organellar RNA editing factor 3, mitochondrial-like isoform X1 [Dendrobium catenatum]
MAAMARRSMSSLLSRALNPSSPSILPSRLPAAASASAVERLRRVASPLTSSPIRWKSSSGAAYYPIMDSSSNWRSSAPKETILLEGCDYEHWLIVMKFPENPKPSEEEMVAAYVDTLTAVVGSEEEAKKKIYSVCTTTYTGFGALISQELSYRVERLPGVLWVLPDSYLDVPNKDYGGDLFVDGKVIHRPRFRFTGGHQYPRIC